MNCYEFRVKFHAMLDINQPRSFVDDMAEHYHSCPTCMNHVQQMEMVDRTLRLAPEPEVPAGLEEKLQAIPVKYAARMRAIRNAKIRRAAMFAIPVTALAATGLAFAPEFHSLILSVVAALAFIALLLQRMHRNLRKS